MNRKGFTMALVFCLASGFAYADGSEVVTNQPRAVQATMSFDPGICTTTVNGHVNPAYKGFGTSVTLVCMTITNDCLSAGQCSVTTVGSTAAHCGTDDICAPGVDPCTGQFTFRFQIVDFDGACVQSAPADQVCYFVAHVNLADKHVCNGKINDILPDPNGSSPCSGGYCPVGP